MKHYKIFIYGFAWIVALMACDTHDPFIEKEEPTTIRISTTPMMQMNELSTRALFPVQPEVENYIHSLAILVFDEEFTHMIGDRRFYRYLTFTSGMTAVTLNRSDIPASTPSYYYLIANLPEEVLLDSLRSIADNGNQISRTTFIDNMKVEIPYIMKRDSVGLIDVTYMSGQYEGALTGETVDIMMGRIITRLNVSLSVDSGLESLGYGYAIRIVNSSRKAYVISGNNSPVNETEDDSYLYPVELGTTPLTFYYYVGPRSADSEEEATGIEITYGKKDNNGDFDASAMTNRKVIVPLCNTLDGTIPRAYWLNRNSIYNISILLKKESKGNVCSVITDPYRLGEIVVGIE